MSCSQHRCVNISHFKYWHRNKTIPRYKHRCVNMSHTYLDTYLRRYCLSPTNLSNQLLMSSTNFCQLALLRIPNIAQVLHFASNVFIKYEGCLRIPPNYLTTPQRSYWARYQDFLAALSTKHHSNDFVQAKPTLKEKDN